MTARSPGHSETSREPIATPSEPTRTSRRRRRRRLFRKYVVSIVSLVGGILVLSGIIELRYSIEENEASLVALQHEKAKGAAARIEQYMQSIVDETRFSALPQLRDGDEALERQRVSYLRLMRKVPAITDVTHVDPKGIEQLRISRLAMDVVRSGVDHSDEPHFVAAKSTGTWFGPVYFRNDSEPYMALATSRPGARIPATVVDVNLKFIWDVVSEIAVGAEGHAYAVDATGHLIAHPDISLVLQRTDLSALGQVAEAIAALGGGIAGDGGFDTRASALDGQPVLSAYSLIEPLAWAVFVEQPRAQAYAPVYKSAARTGALLVLGLILSLLVSLALARRMVTPIRALQSGASKLGEGRLDEPIAITTGDELEELAHQFNDMAERLRESYATLERRVEERTTELREALERQTATGEILRVISRSPTDYQPVFDAILASATRLCDAPLATLFLHEEGVLRMAAVHGGSAEYVAGLKRTGVPVEPRYFVARALIERRPVAVADLTAEPGYGPDVPLRVAVVELEGVRSMLAVPLLRKDEAVGVIMVYRREVRAFSDKQISLLSTFADQAVIAIENVRLFQELEARTIELEAANRHKSEFLANMSHELRTPLNAVIGFSEVLAERMFGELNEKQAEYVEDIHSSGRHLLSLINDILDLSKIEAGRMELELARFEVDGALDNALTLVSERAARRGLSLARDVDGHLGSIVGDERKCKQVLLNLLSNAIKFTPEGGEVRLGARREERDVVVSVSDTGVGIAPEDQSIIFEEFRQVGSGYARTAEGTGLGLTLTRRFVEMHGGTIAVESTVGVGSVFTFTLPLDGPAASSSHADEDAPGAAERAGPARSGEEAR